MNLKYFTVLIIGISTITIKPSYSQFTDSDITLNVTGLSKEITDAFKNHKSKLTELFNLKGVYSSYGLSKEIAPVRINITYNQGVGYIEAQINYNKNVIDTVNNGIYKTHQKRGAEYSKGQSIILQSEIFFILNQYKKVVNLSLDKPLVEIYEFINGVKLKKSNGDWCLIHQYSTYKTWTVFSVRYSDTAFLQVGGIRYETSALNNDALQNNAFFYIGKEKDLADNKTGAYYFGNFFEL